MKPTKKQLELIGFCKRVLDTFESTEDIDSSTHYFNMMEFINAELDSYPYRIKDGIYSSLIDLLDTIKSYDN